MANIKTQYLIVSYNNFDSFLKEALETTAHTLKNDCKRFLSTLTKDQVSIWKSGQNQDKHLLVEVLTNHKTDIKLLPVSITDPYLYCATWVFPEPIAIYVSPLNP